MKAPDSNTLIQLLGLVGVAASLVFVGLELRQSQQIAIAGQIQARNEAFLDLYVGMMGEESVGRALAADGYMGQTLSPGELDSNQYDMWYAIKMWQVMSLQNAFQQYEMGLLPDNVWTQVSSRINEQYANCFIRPIWMNQATPSMTEYLNSIPQACSVGSLNP